MGVALSIPELQGLVTATNAITPAISTSYAFAASNTNQFGAYATIAPDFGSGFYTARASLIYPGTDGLISTATCAPTLTQTATASLLCAVTNAAIGPGTATISFNAGYSNTFFFSVASQETQTVTTTITTSETSPVPTVTTTSTPVVTETSTPVTTLTGASSTLYTGCTTTTTTTTTTTASSTTTTASSTATTASSTTSSSTTGTSTTSSTTTALPKCRVIPMPAHEYMKRDTGYSGPDFTLSNGEALPAYQTTETATVTTTVPASTTATVTVTGTDTSTSTSVLTSTSTVDERTVTTVSGCAPTATVT